MQRPLKAVTGALLLMVGTLGAQENQAAPKAQQIDTLLGTISATLPSGVELRGSGATVSIWADQRELLTALESACIAARANPSAWIAARTELEAPSGVPLDSVTGVDLAILKRIAAIPHADARADSSGRFMFTGVPTGRFWIEAEMMQGTALVQWWHRFSMEPVDFAFARLFGQKTTKVPIKLVTQDFTHDQFCTGGEQPLGAAEFEVGHRSRSPSAPPMSAYQDVDELAVPLDDFAPNYPDTLRKQRIEGTVTTRFVVDTTGYVDMRTVRIISSPDSRFSEAVLTALRRKRYRPGRIDGHDVRSEVKQDFVFSLRG